MWKLKILFLLIIYFSGFATAIYYLAPNDRMNCKAAEYSYNSGNSGVNESQNSSSSEALKQMCEKAYSKAATSLLAMKEKDFKDAFDRGLKAIREMAQNSPSTETKDAENQYAKQQNHN